MPPTKPIPEMSWTTADDKVQKVADLRGKAVILDFWATNCPPCREEIPHLNALLAKYGADIEIRGLHVGDEEDRREIPNFISKTKLDYPIAYPETELSRFVFSDRDDIPQTLIIDRSGRLIKKIVGFSPAIQAELDAAVNDALKAN
jgi:thiol-disulfide isomerase/thioredoxin